MPEPVTLPRPLVLGVEAQADGAPANLPALRTVLLAVAIQRQRTGTRTTSDRPRARSSRAAARRTRTATHKERRNGSHLGYTSSLLGLLHRNLPRCSGDRAGSLKAARGCAPLGKFKGLPRGFSLASGLAWGRFGPVLVAAGTIAGSTDVTRKATSSGRGPVARARSGC